MNVPNPNFDISSGKEAIPNQINNISIPEYKNKLFNRSSSSPHITELDTNSNALKPDDDESFVLLGSNANIDLNPINKVQAESKLWMCGSNLFQIDL